MSVLSTTGCSDWITSSKAGYVELCTRYYKEQKINVNESCSVERWLHGSVKKVSTHFSLPRSEADLGQFFLLFVNFMTVMGPANLMVKSDDKQDGFYGYRFCDCLLGEALTHYHTMPHFDALKDI